MSIRQFLDDHPLAVVASVVVASVGIAVSITEFFADKRLDMSRAHHEAKLSALEEQYKFDNRDLSRRLASIERRVGENPKYFDVSNVILPRDQLRQLSPEHRDFIKGYFYVSVPDDPSWSYKLTNELEIARSTLPPEMTELPETLSHIIQSSDVHLWSNEESKISFACEFAVPIPFECIMTFRPLVMAQRISREMMMQRGQALGEVFESSLTELQSLEETLSNLNSLFQDENITEGDISMIDPELNEPQKMSEEVVSVLGILEQLLNEELASLMLMDKIASALMMSSIYKNHSYVMHSVQKKGNIFYSHAQLKFQRVRLTENAEMTDVVVDEELFFVGTYNEGLLVRVLMPSIDGRASEYDWVHRWLSDFRVVI